MVVLLQIYYKTACQWKNFNVGDYLVKIMKGVCTKSYSKICDNNNNNK